ncbi:unnamed protein product [Calicophoron daubneyi]|uniref:Actin n=1 Tax=Calicophoron daubneyi TaxID=300641 RepID=A0AAV2T4I6_CALDB
MSANETPAVVLDIGSENFKAGLAGANHPRSVFPCIIGRPKYPRIQGNYANRISYLGNEAQERRGVLYLTHPVNRGVVTNWDDMQMLWEHVLHQELQVAPEDHAVLFTEPPMNPKINRELMAQMAFETFRVPALSVAIPAALAFYAFGQHTGLSLDCGEGVTNVVPIHQDCVLSKAVIRVNFAGCDLTEYLVRLLLKKGYPLTTTTGMDIVRDLKEHSCFVASSAEQKVSNLENHSYRLPDGQIIRLGDERFLCPDALFRPEIAGALTKGLHGLCREAVDKVGAPLQRELYSNTVLSGGSTMFSGMISRMSHEMSKLFPGFKPSYITARPDRAYAAWTGGSILGSLSTFHGIGTSKVDA